MSTPINRRKFLSRTVQTAGVAFAMQSFVARGALAASGDDRGRGRRCDGDYGDLAPTASENTGETILALPEGFRYNVFGRRGEIMSDGKPTPGARRQDCRSGVLSASAAPIKTAPEAQHLGVLGSHAKRMSPDLPEASANLMVMSTMCPRNPRVRWTRR